MLIHSILSNESWAKMNIFFKCIKKIRERVVWENIWTDSCLSRHFIRSLAEPLLTPGRRDKTTVRSGVEDRGGGRGWRVACSRTYLFSATTATHFDCQQQFAFGLTIVRLWSFFASALSVSQIKKGRVMEVVHVRWRGGAFKVRVLFIFLPWSSVRRWIRFGCLSALFLHTHRTSNVKDNSHKARHCFGRPEESS